MSGASEERQEISSCVTAKSSDLSFGSDNVPLPSKSSSLLSGYHADMDSSGGELGLENGPGSEQSEEVVARANSSGHLEEAKTAEASSVHEQIGDTEEGNRPTIAESVLDGDNSSSVPARRIEIEDMEDQAVANLRRKRTDAEGPADKKRRF